MKKTIHRRTKFDLNIPSDIANGRRNIYIHVQVSMYLNIEKPIFSQSYALIDTSEAKKAGLDLNRLRAFVASYVHRFSVEEAKELQPSTTIVNSNGVLHTLVA